MRFYFMAEVRPFRKRFDRSQLHLVFPALI